MKDFKENNKILQEGLPSPLSLLFAAYDKQRKISPHMGWIFILTVVLSFTFSFGLMYLGF
ncbi:hypothetical protein FAI40_08315 [Acetobacteraceae bacterium]|nr:hypothetical protein FAI40_08315 [Acetobacteraceae bacterium]